MATFAINPTGLRRKPTYESQVNYIANQPRIAYPDRNATMVARSQKMAQLFNENAAQMAEQQAKAQQNKMMEGMISGIAERLASKGMGKGTAALIEASVETDPVSVSEPDYAITRTEVQTDPPDPPPEQFDKAVQVPEKKKGDDDAPKIAIGEKDPMRGEEMGGKFEPMQIPTETKDLMRKAVPELQETVEMLGGDRDHDTGKRKSKKALVEEIQTLVGAGLERKPYVIAESKGSDATVRNLGKRFDEIDAQKKEADRRNVDAVAQSLSASSSGLTKSERDDAMERAESRTFPLTPQTQVKTESERLSPISEVKSESVKSDVKSERVSPPVIGGTPDSFQARPVSDVSVTPPLEHSRMKSEPSSGGSGLVEAREMTAPRAGGPRTPQTQSTGKSKKSKGSRSGGRR